MRLGTRVQTPLGPGVFRYQRMDPFEPTRPVAISVRLDSRADDPRYSGTIFPAEKVTALDGE